ncbi:MAG: ACT domain-containing protein [Clostridia bacterium]|nr:ACT domain-containing protein [Clostridia bacterium]
MKSIITVIGPDRVGIIAEVCTLLAQLHINVIDISQTIMHGMFTMIMFVEQVDGSPAFDEVQRRLSQKGTEMGVEIRVQREDIFNAMHRV